MQRSNGTTRTRPDSVGTQFAGSTSAERCWPPTGRSPPRRPRPSQRRDATASTPKLYHQHGHPDALTRHRNPHDRPRCLTTASQADRSQSRTGSTPTEREATAHEPGNPHGRRRRLRRKGQKQASERAEKATRRATTAPNPTAAHRGPHARGAEAHSGHSGHSALLPDGSCRAPTASSPTAVWRGPQTRGAAARSGLPGHSAPLIDATGRAPTASSPTAVWRGPQTRGAAARSRP